MPRSIRPGLLKVYRMALNSGDLKKAFDQCNGQNMDVGTWGNASKGFARWRLAQAQEATARAAPKATKSKTPRRAGGKKKPPGSARTGPAIGKKTLHTSHQVHVKAKNLEAWTQERNAAHKKATNDFADYVKRKVNKRQGQGFTSAEVAAKWNKTLSIDNPLPAITGDAVRSAVYAGLAGVSPKKPGPKKDEAKAALVACAQSYGRLSQAEGPSCKPSELLAAMEAAADGTVHERHVATAAQKGKRLREVRIDR